MSDHPQIKAISSLLHRLNKTHTFNWVYDGEERVKLSGLKITEAKRECLDVITSVDESYLRVSNKETKKCSTLFIVLGNGNDEIVCDYHDGDDELDKIISQHLEYWENK